MSLDEHLAHYARRTGALPVFGYGDHALLGDAFFDTLDRYRLHHHAEIQLSLGLDVARVAAEPYYTPKGGFTCVPTDHAGVSRRPWGGVRALPAPRRP